MARTSVVAQDRRSSNNPLNLGTFSSTSLRYLKGSLGPKNRLVGYTDTNQLSNGGFGGGTLNNWFSITITSPAWLILTKGAPRPKYIQTSAYDLNHIPIQGEAIFDEDSVRDGLKRDGEVYIPYLGAVMSAQSDLYNNFEAGRLDRGDERYYPLAAGSYLICVSSTRNEPLNYEVGVVIEFPVTELFAALEDTDETSFFLQETAILSDFTVFVPSNITVNTIISSSFERPNGFTEAICTINGGVTVEIGLFLRSTGVTALPPGTALLTSPISTDTIISSDVTNPNAFTEATCTINSGITVTILASSIWFISTFTASTWLIGNVIPSSQEDNFKIILEPGNDESFDAFHDHSLSEWKGIWDAEHQDTDPFPTLFTSLTNRL